MFLGKLYKNTQLFWPEIYKNTQLLKNRNSKNVILHPKTCPKM